MRMFVKVFSVLCIVSLVFCALSYAEEEKEGFMKRMWGRFGAKTEKDAEEGEEIAPMPEGVPMESAVKKEPEGERTERKTDKDEAIPRPKLTKEEIIERMEKNLERYGDELLSAMPNIIKKEDEEGNVVYLFRRSSGQEVEFEELSEEELLAIYRKMINEVAIIRYRRVEKQLETLERIPKIPKAVSRPTPEVPKIPEIPKAPKTYKPPRVPKVPR
jgi:hypothetical protein